MAIKINHNIFSMLVQRNLARTSQKVEKSYDRLSSGERINTSADDPAGMATSEQFRYEVQGLRQNQQNVSGAFSLLGTAESQLSTMTNLLQRARELTVQAGNGTLSPTDRSAIQAEVSQLSDELNRVASTARLNDQFLLNGQLNNISIQIGTRSADTLSISLGDFRTATLGSRANKDSDQPVGGAAITAGTVQINGIAVPPSAGDGSSTVLPNASAIAKANAINEVESQTGVHAEALPATVAGVGALQPVTLDGTTRALRINGVSISPVTVKAGDSGGALTEAINARTVQTGVSASVVGGQLQLSSTDGRNIEVVTLGGVGGTLGLRVGAGDVNRIATGKIELSSTRAFSVSDPGALLGLTTPVQQVNPDPSKAIQTISVSDVASTTSALKSIDAALLQISDGLSSLGAVHNRLDGLSDNLSQRIEDLSSADSRIRDADYAFESAQLTQGQILQNAAIAMLAQANVAPQRALDLLRG